MDFVVSLFRHKLGSSVIDPDTHKIRSASGTIEELNLTLDNANINYPLGMLYCYSEVPQVLLNDPLKKKKEQDWYDLQRFMEEVKNRMIYKKYKTPEELPDIICKDIANLMSEYFG